jgi:hypothetical protein
MEVGLRPGFQGTGRKNTRLVHPPGCGRYILILLPSLPYKFAQNLQTTLLHIVKIVLSASIHFYPSF